VTCLHTNSPGHIEAPCTYSTRSPTREFVTNILCLGHVNFDDKRAVTSVVLQSCEFCANMNDINVGCIS
jgi:hypothetical protein